MPWQRVRMSFATRQLPMISWKGMVRAIHLGMSFVLELSIVDHLNQISLSSLVTTLNGGRNNVKSILTCMA
jgi:predicted DNA-binding ribbon-helix-helix protein